jgi:hypothetical protein
MEQWDPGPGRRGRGKASGIAGQEHLEPCGSMIVMVNAIQSFEKYGFFQNKFMLRS